MTVRTSISTSPDWMVGPRSVAVINLISIALASPRNRRGYRAAKIDVKALVVAGRVEENHSRARRCGWHI